MKVWDWINTINANKPVDTTKEDMKDYVPFVVNRAMSYFPDTILCANDMNLTHHIDKDQQYTYYINTVRPARRYKQWGKVNNAGEVEIISEYYQVSPSKAKTLAPIHTAEQIEYMRRAVDKGGKV